MAITQVGVSQATTISGSGASLSRAAGAVNNLIIVGASVAATSSANTISDTQGNSWQVANPDLSDATNAIRSQTWYCLAKNTTSTTITVSGATAFRILTVEEFTGNNTSTPLDQVHSSPAGSSGTPSSGNITLGADNCLVWSWCADTVTAVGNIDGSAATKGADDGGGDWTEFRILSGRSGISVSAAFTGTLAYTCHVASFKPSGVTITAFPHYTRPFPFVPGSSH